MTKKAENSNNADAPSLNIDGISGSVFFTSEEVKDLKRIRNYFGENDKTLFEHLAYSYLDNVLKRINTDR